ncbi:hypothetical protein HYU15_00365 [Candidatus Woesearchaeota archaeon]|nr:hypothetical protein [Candidatus Woesearchaeota archaeon]
MRKRGGILSSKDRKAALDVSINSIVVIVFAVTMLGLGLAFIKGYFEKAKSTINIDEVGEVPDATVSNPISLAREDLNVEKGKTSTFGAKFYNNKETSYSASFGSQLQCVSDTGTATAGSFVLLSSPQTVNVGEQKQFKLQLKVAPTTVSKDYICTLQALSATGTSAGTVLEEKQVTVKVK